MEPMLQLVSFVDRQTSAADLILSAGVPCLIAVALFGALASAEFVANGRRARPLVVVCMLGTLLLAAVAVNGTRTNLGDDLASDGVFALVWPHGVFFLLLVAAVGLVVWGVVRLVKTPVEEFGPTAKWFAIPVAVATTALGWRHVDNMGDVLYREAENVGARMTMLHYAAFYGPLGVVVALVVWGLVASRRNMSEI